MDNIGSFKLKRNCPNCEGKVNFWQLMGDNAMESCKCKACEKKICLHKKSIKIPVVIALVFILIVSNFISRAFTDSLLYQIILGASFSFSTFLLIFIYNFTFIDLSTEE
jgi:hypothetical protein